MRLNQDYMNEYWSKRMLARDFPESKDRLALLFIQEPVRRYSKLNDTAKIPASLKKQVKQLDELADYVNANFTNPRKIDVDDVKRVIGKVEKIMYKKR